MLKNNPEELKRVLNDINNAKEHPNVKRWKEIKFYFLLEKTYYIDQGLDFDDITVETQYYNDYGIVLPSFYAWIDQNKADTSIMYLIRKTIEKKRKL